MAGRKIMAFIGRREGLVKQAYPDGRYYSIGFGHNGPDVYHGRRVTLEQALDLFRDDLNEFETRLHRALKGDLVWMQHETDALLSAAYNLGNAGVASVIRLLNAENRKGAMAKLEELCKVKVPDDGDPDTPPQFIESAGLKKRRAAERKLFETGNYGDISSIPYWDGNPFKTPMKRMLFPEAST